MSLAVSGRSFTLGSRVSLIGFVAALIQALAWPLALTVVALVFRKDIVTLIRSQVRRVKAGPFEMELDPLIARVEVDVESAQASATLPAKAVAPGNASALPSKAITPSNLVSELLDLARTAPAKAVKEAYSRLENRLSHLIETRTSISPSARSAPVLATVLASSGVLTREMADAVKSVASLQSAVTKAQGEGYNLTVEQATEYLGIVDNLLKLIPPE